MVATDPLFVVAGEVFRVGDVDWRDRQEELVEIECETLDEINRLTVLSFANDGAALKLTGLLQGVAMLRPALSTPAVHHVLAFTAQHAPKLYHLLSVVH